MTVFFQADRLRQERSIALAERDSARQVAAYMTEVFQLSSPFESGGAEIKARELLDCGADRIRHLENQPLVEARLRHVIGRAYLDLGMPASARPLLEESLKIRRRLRANPTELAESLAGLRTLEYESAQDFPRAESLARETIAVLEGSLEPSASSLAQAHASLGGIMARLGRWREALAAQHQALEMARSLEPEDPELITEILLRQAVAERNLERPEDARRTLEDAIPRSVTELGEDHFLSLRGLFQKATLDLDQHRTAKAETTLLEVLRLQTRLLGEQNPELAYPLSRLGDAQMQQGRLDEAEVALRRALELRKQAFGERHLSVAASLGPLADLESRRGNFATALALARESLTIAQENLPPTSLKLADLFGFVGRVALEADETQEAEGHLRRASELLKVQFPADHPRRVKASEAHEKALSLLQASPSS